MSDDLFEFLAAQEAGRAAQEAERATEHKRPVEIRSIIDKTKVNTTWADSGSPGMPDRMRYLRLGTRRLHRASVGAR
jgi:hypothetical protein